MNQGFMSSAIFGHICAISGTSVLFLDLHNRSFAHLSQNSPMSAFLSQHFFYSLQKSCLQTVCYVPVTQMSFPSLSPNDADTDNWILKIPDLA